MKNFILRYGLVGGCISIFFGLLNWFTIAPFTYNGSQIVGYITLILSLLCIPAGIKYFRDKLNSGNVTFAQSFKIGLGITVIASIVMFLYSSLFFIFAGDTFTEWQAEANPQAAEIPEFMMNPWAQGLIMFFISFFIGLIINLISSLVLKQNMQSASA